MYMYIKKILACGVGIWAFRRVSINIGEFKTPLQMLIGSSVSFIVKYFGTFHVNPHRFQPLQFLLTV